MRQKEQQNNKQTKAQFAFSSFSNFGAYCIRQNKKFLFKITQNTKWIINKKIVINNLLKLLWHGVESVSPQTMGRQKTRGFLSVRRFSRFWKQGIKSNSVILHFSSMDNKFAEEQERFLNSLSDIPPPPFRVREIVVRQPSERKIYQKQIEP